MVRTANGKNVVGSDVLAVVIPGLSVSVSVQKSPVLGTDVERLGTTME